METITTRTVGVLHTQIEHYTKHLNFCSRNTKTIKGNLCVVKSVSPSQRFYIQLLKLLHADHIFWGLTWFLTLSFNVHVP